MSRIAMGIEYVGTSYCGWQAQEAGIASVQVAVEAALSQVANEPVRVQCAGRTDTGVHALGQVVHFDTTAKRSVKAWVLGCNSNLPADVSICWAKLVADEFHARFTAVERHYIYKIVNRQSRPAINNQRMTWVYRELDADIMHQAAQSLLGTHDFSSYRATHCQANSPIRTINAISVERNGDIVELKVSARSFLHHMIRNIAGVLIAIGSGERALGWEKEILAHCSRRKGGVTAPAAGLYFASVDYPPEMAIPNTLSFRRFNLSA